MKEVVATAVTLFIDTSIDKPLINANRTIGSFVELMNCRDAVWTLGGDG